LSADKLLAYYCLEVGSIILFGSALRLAFALSRSAFAPIF